MDAKQGLLNLSSPVVPLTSKLRESMLLHLESVQAYIDQLEAKNVELVTNIELSQNAYAILSDQFNNLGIQHRKVVADFNNTCDLYEKLKNSTVSLEETVLNFSPTAGVLFDSKIHSYKPLRPITRAIRDQIMSAYESVYKDKTEKITLPDFFKYVQDNICPTASRTEIEGVIYNRFDERLYA